MTLYSGKTLDELEEVARKLTQLGVLIESQCCKDGGPAIPALIARIKSLEDEVEILRRGHRMSDKHSPAALEMAREIEAAHTKIPTPSVEYIASIIDAGNAELVKAVELFRDEGTILTACDRGACQQVVEKDDKSDPQARLYNTLIKYTVEQ